jgi:hypothetical protein
MDHVLEIYESLFELLQVDVDLSTGLIGLHVPGELLEAPTQGLERTRQIVVPPECDRLHHVDCLVVGGFSVDDLLQVLDALPWLLTVQVADGPVVLGVAVIRVHLQRQAEVLDRLLIVFGQQLSFTLLEVAPTLTQDLLLLQVHHRICRRTYTPRGHFGRFAIRAILNLIELSQWKSPQGALALGSGELARNDSPILAHNFETVLPGTPVELFLVVLLDQ